MLQTIGIKSEGIALLIGEVDHPEAAKLRRQGADRGAGRGMRIVGEDFRDGILFVTEVLLTANAMKAGMAILRPLLAATGAPKQGKMVIGTAEKALRW